MAEKQYFREPGLPDPPGRKPPAGVRTFPVMVGVLIASLLLVPGCASLQDHLEQFATGNSSERDEAMVAIDHHLRSTTFLTEEEAGTDRKSIDEALQRMFWQRTTDPALKARILHLALQGELPGRQRLAMEAANDSQWIVRLEAVKAIREISLASDPTPQARVLLTNLLAADENLFVRIESARTIGIVGANTPEWTDSLLAIVSDDGLNSSLRYQAYRAARRLTGRTDPFVSSYWRH